MTRTQKICAICLVLLLFVFCLMGCQTPNAKETDASDLGSAETYTFTDALGQEITIERPERVVSLMGSFSEIWVLAGGADTLVGTSEDTTDTRDLGLPEDVASVGTYQNPNMETIIALDPDLVLLSSETVRTDNHVALKDRLAAANIPAAYFSVTHFEDYLAMLKICTDLTGNAEAYQTHGIAVQERITQILEEYKQEDAPSVLLLITYSGGIRPQSSDTMTGKMLTQLGCHNILDDYPSLLQDFSIEEIINVDPDYIFVIPMGNDEAAIEKNLRESVESNPAWSSLTAVKNGRYLLLPREKFLYKPNANWADSYEYLGQLFANHTISEE